MILSILLLALSAHAAPCPKASVPAASGDKFLKNRLLGDGVNLVASGNPEERWRNLVLAARIEEETSGFDLVDRQVFERRLSALSLKELALSYPQISKEKLKKAKAEAPPCI